MSDYPHPQISVTGGRGGHYAITHDLELAARILSETADELHFSGGEMDLAHGYAMDAANLAIPEVRPSVLQAQHAVHDTRYGAGGFKEIAGELEDVSVRIASVAKAYERAEAAAYQGVSTATRLKRGVSDLLGVWAWGARTAWGNAIRYTPVNWASTLVVSGGISGAIRPDQFPRITGLLNSASATAIARSLQASRGVFGSHYTSILWLLAGGTSILEKWAGEPRYVGATVASQAHSHPQARGVADMVADIDDTYRLDHGGITIDTITHPDGSYSHVVNIPGTNDNSFSDKSVWDWNGNFRLKRNQLSDSARLVWDAIEASGINPGDPIMLQGHSQGGIAAAQLAGSQLAATYSITHVVTYGSPVGLAPINTDVEYLHLGTAQDPTHGADGRYPVDRPNITNVEADLRAAPDPALVELADTVPDSHSTEAYFAVAQSTDASSRVSVVAWRESAAGFMGDGMVSRQEFKPVFETPAPVTDSEVYGPPVPEVFGPPVPKDAIDPLMCDAPPSLADLVEAQTQPVIEVPSRGGVLQPLP